MNSKAWSEKLRGAVELVLGERRERVVVAGGLECGVQEHHGEAEDRGVDQPEPGGQQRQVAPYVAEQDQQSPGDHDIEDEDRQEGSDADPEQRLGGGQIGERCARVVVDHRADCQEVREEAEHEEREVAGACRAGGGPG